MNTYTATQQSLFELSIDHVNDCVGRLGEINRLITIATVCENKNELLKLKMTYSEVLNSYNYWVSEHGRDKPNK